MCHGLRIYFFFPENAVHSEMGGISKHEVLIQQFTLFEHPAYTSEVTRS